jgi:hypothetical protein
MGWWGGKKIKKIEKWASLLKMSESGIVFDLS